VKVVTIPRLAATRFDLPAVCVLTGAREGVVWERVRIGRVARAPMAMQWIALLAAGVTDEVLVLTRWGPLVFPVIVLSLGWILIAAARAYVGADRVSVELGIESGALTRARWVHRSVLASLFVLWLGPLLPFAHALLVARSDPMPGFFGALVLGCALVVASFLAVIRVGNLTLSAPPGQALSIRIKSSDAATVIEDALAVANISDTSALDAACPRHDAARATFVCTHCGDLGCLSCEETPRLSTARLCPPCRERRRELVAELEREDVVHLANSAMLLAAASLIPLVPTGLMALVASIRALRNIGRAPGRPGAMRAKAALLLSIAGLGVGLATAFVLLR
jgi:hypothetical protein